MTEVSQHTRVLEDGGGERVADSFFRSMTWGVRIAVGWLVLLLVFAVFADWIPFVKDPNYLFGLFEGYDNNQGPTAKFWLGTDSIARDNFARLVYGARVSVTVAAVAVTCGLVFGGFLGSFVGFFRGKPEAIVMATVDVILAFPGLVLLLVMVSITQKRSLFVISMVVGLLSIPPYTRVARANALSIANREFVEAARADMRLSVWPVVYPSAALVFTVLSLNMVGDWLRQRNASRAAAI